MSLTKTIKDNKEEYENTIRKILVDIGAIEYCSCGAKSRLTGKLDENEISKLVEQKLKKQGKEFDKKVLDEIISETPYSNKCEYCEDIDDWFFLVFINILIAMRERTTKVLSFYF